MKSMKLLSTLSILLAFSCAQALECSSQALKTRAIESLTMSGKKTKISVSSPFPIYERSFEFESEVIGYSIRYYRELNPNYGILGELVFIKLGDYCELTQMVTSDTVTPIETGSPNNQ